MSDTPKRENGNSQKDERLLPPRRSAGAWIQDLFLAAISLFIGVTVIWLIGKGIAAFGTLFSSLSIPSFSISFLWSFLWGYLVLAALLLLCGVLIWRVWKRGINWKRKDVKEVGAMAMYTILFIGASLVLFRGAGYIKEHTPSVDEAVDKVFFGKPSVRQRTVIATPDGVTQNFSCPYNVKWDKGKIKIRDRSGRIIYDGTGKADYGKSPSLNRQTFYGDNIPIHITEKC